MSPKRSLPLSPAREGLGLPTIMDRALAAAHGVGYVHLVVFAIDVDRVYWLHPERKDLPFGWEVFLTECYLLARIDTRDEGQREMLEAVCADVMEETPGEPPLGGQLVFAVYDALERKALPELLRAPFRGWRRPPEDLLQSLDRLWKKPGETLATIATACLEAELDPPLAPPTRATLEAMARAELAPPALGPRRGASP